MQVEEIGMQWYMSERSHGGPLGGRCYRQHEEPPATVRKILVRAILELRV